MVYLNYYDILGVTPDATPKQIKKAYRRKMREDHPDGLPPDQRGIGTELSKVWNEAYAVLSDEEKKRNFDAERDERIRTYRRDSVALPANDLPLLAALTTLHSPLTAEGKYATIRSPQDKRERTGASGVSNEIYKVTKNSQGVIGIYRRIDDFRLPTQRRQEIRLNTNRLTYNPLEFFSLHELKNYGGVSRERFSDVMLPSGFADYLLSLDMIAFTIVRDGIQPDFSLKDQFSEHRLADVREMCIRLRDLNAENRGIGGPLMSISLENFAGELRNARGLIRAELQTGPEGIAGLGRRL